MSSARPEGPLPTAPVIGTTAIEAAARALAPGDMYEYPCTDVDRERFRVQARAVLAAALPAELSLEDLAGAINEAAFDGVEFDHAMRVASYLHPRYAVSHRVPGATPASSAAGESDRKALAAAWLAGRESVALDLMKPLNDAGMRPASPNPFEV